MQQSKMIRVEIYGWLPDHVEAGERHVCHVQVDGST